MIAVISTMAAVRRSATKLIPNGAIQEPNWVASMVPSSVALSSAIAETRNDMLAIRLVTRCKEGRFQSDVVSARPSNGIAMGAVSRRCEGITAWPPCSHRRVLLHPHQRQFVLHLSSVWGVRCCRLDPALDLRRAT